MYLCNVHCCCFPPRHFPAHDPASSALAPCQPGTALTIILAPAARLGRVVLTSSLTPALCKPGTGLTSVLTPAPCGGAECSTALTIILASAARFGRVVLTSVLTPAARSVNRVRP